MTESRYQLAQINIGRIVAPLTEAVMYGFVSNLEPINALADSAPGFIWRFQTAEGDATSVRPYDDDRLLINFSVWADLASLREFVYSRPHGEIMKRRREWFELLSDAYLALWWVPRDHRPTVEEAVSRMEHLKRHGPSPHAFTFRETYPAPDLASAVGSNEPHGV